MATNQYIGARYVPVFADPAEWNDTRTYEPLTIVLHEGNSYTSAQYVPKGIDISNEDFWKLTGNYNAQVEQYRKEVITEIARATAAEGTLQSNINSEIARAKKEEEDINANFKYVTPEQFGAVGNGITDDTEAFKKALATLMPVYLTNQYFLTDIDLSLYETVFIYSDYSQKTYSTQDITKGVIKFADKAGFTSKWMGEKGNAVHYTFKNISMYGGFIKDLWSVDIINCTFYNTNNSVLHGGFVFNTTFNKCALPFLALIDSIILGSSFNLCDIAIQNPNSTIISNCCIQWCGVGINVTYGLNNSLISNCRFDRNDIAINLETKNQCLNIVGNVFHRSVNHHITGNLGSFFIGNSFIKGNTSDDGTGTYAPTVPFNFKNQSGATVFNDNAIEIAESDILNLSDCQFSGSITGNNNYLTGGNGTILGSYKSSGTGTVTNGVLTVTLPVNSWSVRNPIIRISYSGHMWMSTECHMPTNGYNLQIPFSGTTSGDVTYEITYNKPFSYLWNGKPIDK